MRYAHTNIITDDWEALAVFYERVFQCVRVPPQRDQEGEWLDRGIGLQAAHLTGVHLLLPGQPEGGVTLEIYSYDKTEDCPAPVTNQRGFRHIAFEVDDVAVTMASVLEHGGGAVGELSSTTVDELGTFSFVYVADPDGNIIELQHWDRT